MSEAVLTQARRLSQRGNHELALEILRSHTKSAFDQAYLDKNSHLAFDFYNLRAELFEHCRIYEKAKVDAQALVKLRVKDPQGYIRLARAYLALGRPADAVVIANRGLHRIGEFEDRCSELRKIALFARRKLADAQTRRVDPLKVLPSELVYMVWKYAGFKLRNTVRLLQVSKSWKKYLEADSYFWSELEFDAVGTPITQKTIATYAHFARLGFHLDITKASVLRSPDLIAKMLSVRYKATLLSFHSTLDSGHMTANLFRASNLTFPRLTELSMATKALDADIAWSLTNLPKLRKLILAQSVASKPQVRVLPEVVSPDFSELGIFSALQTELLHPEFLGSLVAHRTLRKIAVSRITSQFALLEGATINQRLRSLEFRAIDARNVRVSLPEFAGSLSRLVLSKLSIELPSAWDTAQRNPLVYLELKGIKLYNGSLDAVLELLCAPDMLQTLVIDDLDAEGVPILPPSFLLTKLHTLQLTSMSVVGEALVDFIIQAMPALRTIKLDQSQVTGAQVIRLVHHGVRTLSCQNCPLSYETIRWLRELPGEIAIVL